MSGDEIDLARLEHYAGAWGERELLALVRAVRAARAFANNGWHVQDRMDLDAALAAFTDSAEVRSDD